jgi:hypothetical protein
MRFHPKAIRFSPFPPPSLGHRIRLSCVDSPLGGGAPTNTTTVREVLRAGAPPRGAPAIVKDRSNYTIVAGSLWTDSIAEGEQNGVP